MPESRDRLVRNESTTPILPRRSVGGVWFDTEQESGFGGRNLFGSPMQIGGSTAATGTVTRGSLIGSPLIGRTGYAGSPWGRLVGQENRGLGGSGRRGGRARVRNTRSLLPTWYPRRPFQDVTVVVNAIERRRNRQREAERYQLASPLQHPAQGAPLEHSFDLTTPKPRATIKNFQLPLHIMSKSLVGNQAEGDEDFLTPEKKLLNSIDQVEKVMKEEFKRMKRTPVAKKAERNNKVRTLMAMR